MKIGIDISLLCVDKTGIGQYKFNIISELIKIRPNWEFYLYGFKLRDRFFDELPFFKSPNCRCDVKKFPNRLISGWWSLGSWPKLERVVENCDLYHLSETSSQPSKKPSVATIHELTIEKFPELHLRESVFFSKRRHQALARSNTHLIAISEQTKRDFMEIYGVSPERISVIGHGVTEDLLEIGRKRLQTSSPIPADLSDLGIKKPFILYLGTIEPRKNLPRVLKAFRAANGEGGCGESGEFQLVLAGKEGWHMEEFLSEIKEAGDVVMTGFVREELKRKLLGAASGLVYVSHYEGFGMPVLEGMASGVPVLASKIGAIEEFAEGVVVLVDPKKDEELEDEMKRLLSGKYEEAMQKKAFEKAEEMTWQLAAEKTAELYERILKKN